MAILYNSDKKIFTMHTRNSTYQMMVDQYGNLLHLYYGARSSGYMDYLLTYEDVGFSGNPYTAGEDRTYSLDMLPQEYPTLGTGDCRSYALNVENENGSQCCCLTFSHYAIRKGKYQLQGLPCVYAAEEEADTLEIVLKDVVSKVEVHLLYGILEEIDVITRSVVICNAGDSKITLKKAAGACLDFLSGEYDVLGFAGRHAMERNLERRPVVSGVTSFGSRRGASSHQHNPAVILAQKHTTEDFGKCYGMLFVYSGNFLCEAEKDQRGQTRLLMGLNTDWFSYPLEVGAEFLVPEVILSYSSEGFSRLSHNYHACILEHLCRGRFVHEARPVLLNSWEAAYFKFNGETIVNLAREASELGMDMVVMDDGWFGKRDDDDVSLGDWQVNEKKLGCTLAELIEKVNQFDVKFGIWVEPEMVNEDSDLYRTHPDWAIAIENRAPVRSRNQLLLDFSRKEVREHVFGQISAILDQGKIEYLKWDMNRSMTDVYDGKLTYDYVLGVYDFLEKLLVKYPNLLVEGCCGGGGRFDAGMLYYTPQIWCSDNTDAVNRTRIQYGTSFFYPISAVGSHVSAVPNHQTGRITSLHTRGIVSMAGTFGYELNPARLTKEERQEVKEQVCEFKKQETLIRQGRYYRLSNPCSDSFAGWMFVSKDQKTALVQVVQLTLEGNMAPTYVKLKGLKPKRMYVDEATGKTYAGAALMECGVALPSPKEEYQAYQILFTELWSAEDLYEVLKRKIKEHKGRMVVSLYGGSGCGKSTLAMVLAQWLEELGVGCYVLSGDQYPRRFPQENDEERHRIFSETGISGLERYLGTPNEIAFEEINRTLLEFKSGAERLSLRRMDLKGEIHYEDLEVQKVQVLFVDWTHGGSEYLSGVDLPIYIDSVPNDTLRSRLRRNRDENTASKLMEAVLAVEQQKLHRQAKNAKIFVDQKHKVQES